MSDHPNLRIRVLVVSADPEPSEATEGVAWAGGQQYAQRDGFNCTGPIEYLGLFDTYPDGVDIGEGHYAHVYALDTDRRSMVLS